MSNNKAIALLVLFSMAAAAAGDAAALPQPTVFAALQVTPEVSDFWQTLSWVRLCAWKTHCAKLHP